MKDKNEIAHLDPILPLFSIPSISGAHTQARPEKIDNAPLALARKGKQLGGVSNPSFSSLEKHLCFMVPVSRDRENPI